MRGGDDVVVVIFRCKCKWLMEKGMDEATRDMAEGKFWSGSGFQQATINCNSKSLKLQQITGGKLTAKRLRCRRWRRRWRWLSSREMSTCGSRRRRQACFPQEPFESQHDTLDRSCPGQGYPFVVIFSANLLFPILVNDYVCVCVCMFRPLLSSNNSRWRWHYFVLLLFFLLLLLLSDKTWHLLQGDEASATSCCWLEPRDKFLWNTFLIYLHQELCVPIVALFVWSA